MLPLGLVLVLIDHQFPLEGCLELPLSEIPDPRNSGGQTTLSSWCIYSTFKKARYAKFDQWRKLLTSIRFVGHEYCGLWLAWTVLVY